MSLALAQPLLNAIADACRQHRLVHMHVFSSALRDDFDPSDSDLDLLVEFQPIEPGALVRAYFALERHLASLTGRSIDLVMADAIRQAVDGISLDGYWQNHLIRSSAEREFTISGEALTQLSQRDRELFAQIETHHRSSAYATSSPTSVTVK